MAKIANTELTNTFNTWRTQTNQTADRVSQFAITNSSLYANTLTANVAFRAKGTSVLQGGVTANRSLTVNNNITVSGNTTLGAAGKTLTTTGAWSHTGTQSISTNFTVSGNTTLGAAGKTQTTTGAWTHTGTQSISTNLTVSGNNTLGTNPASVNRLSGSTTINNKLTLTGNVAISNASSVTTLSGTLSVSKTLTASGNTVISSGLSANGSYGSSGWYLRSNGTTAHWSPLPASSGVSTGKAIAMAIVFGG